jgi:uncharacterized protein YegP (UPF0339 family)
MPKLVRGTALLVALFALSVPATVGVAQDAKKPAKEVQPEKKAKKATGSIEVLENKAGRYYFKVLDAQGKTLAMSPVSGFPDKEAATKAVEALKQIVESAKVVYPEKKADVDDEKETPKAKKKK